MIVNDIYEGSECSQSTILVALDQSAVFDCVEHSTLVRRLLHTFGVTGRALDWLRLYLHSRSSFVRWRGFSSTTSAVRTGVPQCSSLSPLLFSLYIVPLSQVFQSLGVHRHQYADDIQIYISASRANLAAKVDLWESCTASIHSWSLHNGLQLNSTKSELIQFTSGHGRDRVMYATLSSSHHRQWRALVSSSTANLHLTNTLLASPRHACFTHVHCDMCTIHYQTMSRKQLPVALSAPGLITATLCSLACLYQTASRCRGFRTH